MTVGEKIKMVRNEKGLSQQKLADLTGLARITIAQYETNKYQPSTANLKKIANILSVPEVCLSKDCYDSSDLQKLNSSKLSIGERIRVLRIWNGMTKEIFAEKFSSAYRFEKSTHFYALMESLEKPNVNISVDFAQKLSRFFNIPVYILDSLNVNDGSINTDLKPDECIIINAYRKFNSNGKAKINEIIEDLSDLEKYTEPDPADLEEE